jgi:hypothetical protein
MQQPIDHTTAAERESKLLIGVAAGLGCVIVLCLVMAVLVVFLALLWTLQGQLGPGGSATVQVLLSLASLTG